MKNLIKWVLDHPWMALAIVLMAMILSTALIAYIAFEAVMHLLQFTTNGRFDWTARRARFIRETRQQRTVIQLETREMKEAAAQLSAAMDKYEETSKSIH